MLSVRMLVCSLMLAASITRMAFGGDAPAADKAQAEADKKALSPMKNFVGEWRGTGALKDDPVKGAWIEEGEWAWQFKGGRASLVFAAPKGKYYSAGKLDAGEKGDFHFSATLPDGKGHDEFSGEVNKDGDLVLTTPTPGEGRPGRITISMVAKGKRMVMSYQRALRKDQYTPIAELGLTLKGSGFGKSIDMRECIVTGGTGKIQVSYKGQTYYVCCGGCRDEFNENPEKVLAEFKKRKEEEKMK